MSPSRHTPDQGVLVRFWSLDHHRAEDVLWTLSPWDKLVFALEGVLQVQGDERVHILPPSRALCVPAGQAHPSRTLGRAKVRTLYFAPSLSLRGGQRVLQTSPLLRALVDESCRSGPLVESDPRHNALAALLHFEIHRAPSLPSSIPMPVTPWLRGWAESFLDHPGKDGPAGFSQRTAERRMLSETGLTLGGWRQQARALVGLRALSQGATVMEAGMEAGFETTSGFIQSFRRQFGSTPGRILADGPGEG